MNILEYSLTSYFIPSQIVYGTIDYQNKISSLSIFENDPKKYLPSIISHVFNNSLSDQISNPYRKSNINIITGLNIRISDDLIIISPGILIFDGITIIINDIITLKIDKNNYSGQTHLIISIEYIFGLQQPIKFYVWWYNQNDNRLTCINSPGYNWNSKLFIFRVFNLKFSSVNGLSISPFFKKYILINGKQYLSRLPSLRDKYLKYLINTDILETLYPFYRFIGLHMYYNRTRQYE